MIDVRELGASGCPSKVDGGVEQRPPDAVTSLAVRLQDLYPHAPRAVVLRGIDDATRLLSDAHVRLFLPILIERAVSASLRTAVGTTENAQATQCRVGGPRQEVRE